MKSKEERIEKTLRSNLLSHVNHFDNLSAQSNCLKLSFIACIQFKQFKIKLILMNTIAHFKIVIVYFLHTEHNPVPEHEEVESNEEPQHSSHICHQGAEAVRLLLLQHLHRVRGHVGPQHRPVLKLELQYGF